MPLNTLVGNQITKGIVVSNVETNSPSSLEVCCFVLFISFTLPTKMKNVLSFFYFFLILFSCCIYTIYICEGHHCRACGRIFCDECSRWRCRLSPEYGYSRIPQRLCYQCFTNLSSHKSSSEPSMPMHSDNRVSYNCVDCGRDFDLFRRKHFCNGCKDAFCAECTRWRSAIPETGASSSDDKGDSVSGYDGTRDSKRVCRNCKLKYQSYEQALRSPSGGQTRQRIGSKGEVVPPPTSEQRILREVEEKRVHRLQAREASYRSLRQVREERRRERDAQDEISKKRSLEKKEREREKRRPKDEKHGRERLKRLERRNSHIVERHRKREEGLGQNNWNKPHRPSPPQTQSNETNQKNEDKTTETVIKDQMKEDNEKKEEVVETFIKDQMKEYNNEKKEKVVENVIKDQMKEDNEKKEKVVETFIKDQMKEYNNEKKEKVVENVIKDQMKEDNEKKEKVVENVMEEDQ